MATAYHYISICSGFLFMNRPMITVCQHGTSSPPQPQSIGSSTLNTPTMATATYPPSTPSHSFRPMNCSFVQALLIQLPLYSPLGLIVLLTRTIDYVIVLVITSTFSPGHETKALACKSPLVCISSLNIDCFCPFLETVTF